MKLIGIIQNVVEKLTQKIPIKKSHTSNVKAKPKNKK